MLEVVYGSFHELEAAFAEKVRSLKASEPLAPVLVAAPSRRVADRLEKLLAVELGRSYLAVEFATFHSLASAVAVKSGRLDRPVFSDALFYDKLVDKLLSERRDPHRGRWRGLSSAMRSSIKDLADAGVDAAAVLEQYREGLFGEDADLGRLLELYEAYEKATGSLGVLPGSSLVKLAAEAAPESEWLRSFRAVLYYGFYDLTGLQADFFESVAKHHPSTLFYPYRRKDVSFAFADRFFESRLHFGGAPVPAPAAPRPAPKLEAFHASGASDELWKTAKLILKLHEEEGVPFSEIGIVARTLDPYRPFLRSTLDEHGIPFHTTAEEPLLRWPAAKHALSLLTWADRDYPAVAMLDVLGSPACRRRSDGWKHLISRLGIHEGWLQWEGKLESWAAEGDDEIAPKADAVALLEHVRSLKRKLTGPGEPGWAAFSDRARRLLGEELDLSGEEPSVREGIESIFERLAAFEPLGNPTWDEFLETLEEAFRRAKVPIAPRPNLGVRVLDAMAARGESFRALFVLGLKEKLFPRLIREDPFLRDRHRAALRDHAGYWISTKLGGYDEEKLLFRLLVDAASDRLFTLYARSDEKGKVQTPSIYLLELLRDRGAAAASVPLRPAAKLDSESGRLTAKETSLHLALRGADASELYEKLGWPGPAYRQALRAAEAVSGFGVPGPYDGLTGPSPVIDRKLARGLAATAVEDFATCPFKFYAKHVLGIDEPEEARERKSVGTDVRGRIYHRFLERYYQDPGPEFRRIADETFADFGWRSLGVYPLLWRSLREEMEGHLEAFLKRDGESLRASGMKPEKFEFKLEGPVAGLDVPIRGRADRIDVGPKGFRVVDYKTSLPSVKLRTRLMKSQALQLAFYLELAAPGLGLPPAGAALAAIEEEREDELDAGEWAAVRATVLRNVAAMLGLARSGEFFIYPSNPMGHCSWCAYSSACRKTHGPSVFRAERAPGWAAYASAVKGKPV
jgi:ATP-dependent helicase/nuclease subunit B